MKLDVVLHILFNVGMHSSQQAAKEVTEVNHTVSTAAATLRLCT